MNDKIKYLKELQTIESAARMMDISRSMVYQMAMRGDFGWANTKIVGAKVVVIKTEAVKKLMKERKKK